MHECLKKSLGVREQEAPEVAQTFFSPNGAPVMVTTHQGVVSLYFENISSHFLWQELGRNPQK